MSIVAFCVLFFFFQAEDGIRDLTVTGVQTCALPIFGTFSICSRGATSDRCASTMAMFRASAELRAYASGGPLPTLSSRHAPAVRTIVRGMLRKEGITIPQLGRMAVVPVSGSKPKLIFHGARELNAALARLTSSAV